VQNEPGVLSRVSGTLAGRGFNIDSLVVCRTEIRDLSRMCIVLSGQDGVVEQARRQLEDMVRFTSLLSYMIFLTFRIGSSLGSSGLHGNQGYFTRTSPCQGIHPWS
jgi:ACT domain